MSNQRWVSGFPRNCLLRSSITGRRVLGDIDLSFGLTPLNVPWTPALCTVYCLHW